MLGKLLSAVVEKHETRIEEIQDGIDSLVWTIEEIMLISIFETELSARSQASHNRQPGI